MSCLIVNPGALRGGAYVVPASGGGFNFAAFVGASMLLLPASALGDPRAWAAVIDFVVGRFAEISRQASKISLVTETSPYFEKLSAEVRGAYADSDKVSPSAKNIATVSLDHWAALSRHPAFVAGGMSVAAISAAR
jgi:hypothetical protein